LEYVEKAESNAEREEPLTAQLPDGEGTGEEPAEDVELELGTGGPGSDGVGVLPLALGESAEPLLIKPNEFLKALKSSSQRFPPLLLKMSSLSRVKELFIDPSSLGE